MDHAPIGVIASFVSGLTLFSGFGLGTILMAAFSGAFLGARLPRKVTLRFVRPIVAGAMAVVGSGLASGLIRAV